MSEIKISWSALRSHMTCKQQGYLQRTGHRASMENQRVFFPGTVTDRVVRDWLADNPYNNPGLMPEMVETIVAREQENIEKKGKQLRWKDAKDRDNIILECQQAVKTIEPSLNRLVLPYEYDVDFGFKAPMRLSTPDGGKTTAILIGFMDIIVRRDTNLWAVYDVKHTKDDYYWKKTRGQLSFYDMVVDNLFDAPTFEVGLLQPLCKNPEKMFTLSEEDRTILLAHVQGMVDDIYNENFEPDAPIDACYFCNVKHACSRFTPVNADSRRVSLL